MNLGPGFESRLCHLLDVWTWVSYPYLLTQKNKTKNNNLWKWKSAHKISKFKGELSLAHNALSSISYNYSYNDYSGYSDRCFPSLWYRRVTLSFCCARIFIWDRHLTKPTSLRARGLSYLFRRCSDPDPLLLITENNDTTFVRGLASWLVESSKLNMECEPQTGTSWPLTSQRKGVKEEIAHMYMQPITQQPPFFALVMLLGLLVPPPF